MIELVFVIVVIGILATIAIPKFSATRDDATLTKAKTTLASLRSALSQEVQRRQMQGIYTAVTNLGGSTTAGSYIFDYFDGNSNNERVLEYPPKSCKNSSATGCWKKTGNNTYDYILPAAVGGKATISVQNNRIDCSPASKCKYLER
jgi:type II secretory pathway pseudopilin PulG